MLIRHRVYLISAGLVAVLVAIGATAPNRFRDVAEATLNTLGHYFGWFYLISTFVFVIFLLALAMSRYGKIRLGPQDCKPDYGVFSWLSMLLSAGFGVGLVFYGMAEPIQHLMEPPHGQAEPGSTAAASLAMQYSFFHWGVSQWAAFSLVGLIIAFFQFRKDRPGLVSTMVEPVTKNLPKRQLISDSLDVLAVLATVMGVATSLGLGVLQMNGGLETVFGWPDNLWSKVAILGAMGYMLFTGPMVLILDNFVNGLGNYLGNFINMALNIPPFEKSDWMNRFTLFYWAWVIAWSPFVGTFVARISRGRTITEYVLGVLLVPPLLACAWIAVFGTTALDLQLNGGVDLAGAVSDNVANGLFMMYEVLPHSTFLSAITMVILFVFLVTSADSASYIMSQMTDHGSLNPPLYKRLTWGVLISAICITLIVASGLRGLQSASLVAALPFAVVLFLMMGVLMWELRADRRAMLIELFHRNDDTPVGADLFEADDFSDLTTEQRIRRRMPIQRRR